MKSLKLAALGAVVALGFGVAGEARAQEISIATIGPMTGQYAAFGEQMKRGIEMAVADINAAGGVMGKKLKAVIEDDACDPKQARAAAEKVAAAKVAAVMGHFCSGSSIPASEVYWQNKIIQISPASTNPKLTDDAASKGWTNVHRTCGRDDAQGTTAGQYFAKAKKGKKVAILHDKSAYGKGLADETKKAMNAAGLKEALYDAYNPGEKDYSALVTKLKAAKVDVVYVGGYHTEAALMMRQAAEQAFKPVWVSGDAQATDELWKIAGDAAAGFLFTFAPDPRNNPKAKAVVEKFKAGGYDPEGYTLYTYAAVQVWAQAVTKAKSMDMAAVSKAIRGASFDTVIGPLKFDAKGDVSNSEYVFYKWENGKYAETKMM